MLKFNTLFFLAIAACFTAHSSVIYTDINPDSVYTQATHSNSAVSDFVDFNDDGQIDVSFQFDFFGSYDISSFDATPSLTNTGFSVGGGNIINALELNDQIGSGDYAYGGLYYISSFGNSNFLGSGEKYFGLEFKIGAETHYGWILVDFSDIQGTETFTVKSYAYEDSPSTSINAGDTGDGIDTSIIEKSDELLFQANINDEILNIITDQETFHVQIINLAGQVLVENSNAKAIPVHFLRSGHYLIRLESDSDFTVKRVVKL